MVDDDRPSAYRAASIRRVLQDVAQQQGSLMRLRPYLHSLRWRKSGAEVELMRRSARAAAMALQRCMQMSHGGVHEAQIAATFGGWPDWLAAVDSWAAGTCVLHVHACMHGMYA